MAARGGGGMMGGGGGGGGAAMFGKAMTKNFMDQKKVEVKSKKKKLKKGVTQAALPTL